MDILIALTSIALLTALAAAVRATTPLRVCPICAGVSGTWLWMLAARELGWIVEPAVLALLMGGSIVGIAYQSDRRLTTRRGPWFKALFVPAGFLAAYGMATEAWILAAIGAALAVIVGISFTWSGTAAPMRPDVVAEAEKKLEDCCD